MKILLKPVLSICIPTYNRINNLKKLLSYLEANVDLDNIEILISNNASTDSTSEYLKEIRVLKPEYRIYNQDHNLGGDGNMRFLISQARGQYVWLLGDDDYISIDTIKIALDELNTYSPDLYMMSVASYDIKNNIPNKRTNKNYDLRDRLIKVNNATKIKVFCEDLSGMMFMSRLIYKKDILEGLVNRRKYEYASTLYWSGGSLLVGNTMYFSSKAIILTDSNQVISWSANRYRVIYEIIPNILQSFSDFGWRDKDIKKVLDYHMAYLLPNLLKGEKRYRDKFLNIKVLMYFSVIFKNYLLAKFKEPKKIAIERYSI